MEVRIWRSAVQRRWRSIAAVAVSAGLVLATAATATAASVARSEMSSAGATSPPWPILSEGKTGIQVRSLQYLLDARGASLTVDGVFGSRTRASLELFQKDHGIAPTARTFPSTWLALVVTVRLGSVGDAVRAVQEQVNFRNLRGTGLLAVDGIFGPLTDGAVRTLQRAWQIPAHGTVGPVSWRYLVSEYMSG
jgi:peptidoglycan hydrolase-like protein with peptidoglycan-binding domain